MNVEFCSAQNAFNSHGIADLSATSSRAERAERVEPNSQLARPGKDRAELGVDSALARAWKSQLALPSLDANVVKMYIFNQNLLFKEYLLFFV